MNRCYAKKYYGLDVLKETQSLEEQQSRLQEEIRLYQHEKEELEFVLEAHKLHCGNFVTSTPDARRFETGGVPPPSTAVKLESQEVVSESSVMAMSSVSSISRNGSGGGTVIITGNPVSYVSATSSVAGLNTYQLGIASMADDGRLVPVGMVQADKNGVVEVRGGGGEMNIPCSDGSASVELTAL